MNTTLNPCKESLGTLALTCDQVAEKLGLTNKHKRKTICRLAALGLIAGRKVGKGWRFHPQAVDNYLLTTGAR